jgi:hypothetical protein
VYRRLEQARVIVLAPGTLNVWMANPLSAVPTSFRVETQLGSFWGNCVWDALGIPAMLGADGRVATSCPDCGEPIALEIRDGELAPVDAVIHFAVRLPAGGRTSPSLERRCSPSGRRRTWVAGSSSAGSRAEPSSRRSSCGGSRTRGTRIAARPTGGAGRPRRRRRCLPRSASKATSGGSGERTARYGLCVCVCVCVLHSSSLGAVGTEISCGYSAELAHVRCNTKIDDSPRLRAGARDARNAGRRLSSGPWQ